jgi:hypothetical protein
LLFRRRCVELARRLRQLYDAPGETARLLARTHEDENLAVRAAKKICDEVFFLKLV